MSVNNPTILVTGAAGYIGSHTLVELLQTNRYNVIALDNFSNSNEKAYEGVEKITGKNFIRYQVDITDKSALRNVFLEQPQIDGIIHFAAFKAVGESVEKPLLYYQNNVHGQANVLELALEFGVHNFIFSSSCSVYGNVAKLPVNEETVLQPAESPYAYTKQIGENMLKDTCHAYPQLNAIALRYFNPVGAHPTALIGESPRNIPNNLVPVITNTAIGKRAKLTVFGSDYPTRDGSCVRDYIHVSDIANAHVLALQYLLDKKNTHPYDVLNLGTGNGITVLEAIQAFEKVSSQKLNFELGPRRTGDVIAVYADNSKAKNLLNWECKYDINEMMSSAWAWEKSNA